MFIDYTILPLQNLYCGTCHKHWGLQLATIRVCDLHSARRWHLGRDWTDAPTPSPFAILRGGRTGTGTGRWTGGRTGRPDAWWMNPGVLSHYGTASADRLWRHLASRDTPLAHPTPVSPWRTVPYSVNSVPFGLSVDRRRSATDRVFAEFKYTMASNGVINLRLLVGF